MGGLAVEDQQDDPANDGKQGPEKVESTAVGVVKTTHAQGDSGDEGRELPHDCLLYTSDAADE